MTLLVRDIKADSQAAELQRLIKAGDEAAAPRKAILLQQLLSKVRARIDAMGPTDPNFSMKAFSDQLSDG